MFLAGPAEAGKFWVWRMIDIPTEVRDDDIFITVGVDAACGRVPAPFDGLAYIRDVARGRN